MEIPMAFITEIEKHNSKIRMETQKIFNSQSELETKEQSQGLGRQPTG